MCVIIDDRTHTSEKPYVCDSVEKNSYAVLPSKRIEEFTLKRNHMNVKNTVRPSGVCSGALHEHPEFTLVRNLINNEGKELSVPTTVKCMKEFILEGLGV